MILSPSFLLGLLVMVASQFLFQPLPGQDWPWRWAVFALALPAPILLSSWTTHRLRVLARRNERPGRPLRLLCRLQALSVPAALMALLAYGGLEPLALEAAGGSNLGTFVLLLAPLLFMEIWLRTLEHSAARWLADRQLPAPSAFSAGWVRMTLFVTAVILLFAGAADLVESSRSLAVFVHGTALGSTLALLGTVLLLGASLPLMFHWTMPTRRALPWQVADDVRETATRLSFAPSNVLTLDTGHRLINAALIGPFAWPRYLVLTDGILSCLQGQPLAGVVAHEVGHARANHPAWLLLLFGVVPILLVHPASTFDWQALPSWALLGGGAVTALFGYVGLRRLMHRFEYEADQWSAQALGGAQPCISALRRIGDLFPGQRARSSFRHPSEDLRVDMLIGCERDPSIRGRFQRQGRRVRRGILVIVLLVFAVACWSHLQTRSADLLSYRLYTGDFAGAVALLDDLAPQIDSDPQLARLAAEARAAQELMGDGGRWDQLQPELADRAWARALRVLDSDGGAAALSWFVLAATGPERDPVRDSALWWSDALVSEDPEWTAETASHLQQLAGVPTALREASAAYALSSD